MNCPACGSLEARIVRTIMAPDIDRRQRRCRCGVTWNTSERVDRASVHVAVEVKVKGETAQPPPASHAQKRAADEFHLSVSSSDLSLVPLSPSDPNPNASLLSEPRARRRKGRPSTVEYSPSFEKFWDSISMRRGNKQPAFDAWVKIDPPISPDLIFTRYEQWAKTDQWQRGFAQHVATWLNQKGWENEPGPAEFKSNGVPKSVAKGWSGPSQTFAGGEVKL